MDQQLPMFKMHRRVSSLYLLVNDKCKSDKMFFFVKFNNKNASEPCFFFLYGAQSIVNRKMSDFILSVNIVKNHQRRSVYTRVIE